VSDPRLSFVTSLSQGEQAHLLETLTSTTIEIVLSKGSDATLAGQVLTYQLATLCARLFDRIELAGDEEQLAHQELPFVRGPYLAGLRAVLPTLRPLNPSCERHRLIVGVGDNSSSADLYLGSTAWSASVSSAEPLNVEDSRNTIGALSAGTLGASEVFKRVFGRQISGAVIRDYTLSLLDYGDQRPTVEPELPDKSAVDLALFGCGSIGFGFLQSLLLTPSLTGHVVLVDNGKFDAKNPYKYSLLDWEAASDGLHKSLWAEELLTRYAPRLKPKGFVGTAKEYVASLPATYRIPVALSAVDTVEARIEIQDTLPRTVLNSGITGTTAEVSVHSFLEGPCLACLGLNTELESWNPYPIAEQTGLAPDRVLHLIARNEGMKSGGIDAMRAARKLEDAVLQSLDEYVDQPLLSLWNRVAYSQASIKSNTGQEVRVTTAFVSAFAGLLLLAEAVKESVPAFHSYRVDNSYRQDVLGVPAEGLFRYERDNRGWCVCHSAFRRKIFTEMYGVA
jgi:hypothetical protein